MSLEAYKQTLKKQPETPEFEVETPRTVSFGVGKIVFTILIVGLILLAALKNPSKAETKALVKAELVERINKEMGEVIANDKNSGLKQFGAMLGMTFSDKIVDKFTTIEVSDYVIFSTFDCTTVAFDEPKTVVGGVVLFGKLIPLRSDLDEESFDFSK